MSKFITWKKLKGKSEGKKENSAYMSHCTAEMHISAEKLPLPRRDGI
jgi:hypothetical protein